MGMMWAESGGQEEEEEGGGGGQRGQASKHRLSAVHCEAEDIGFK